MVKRAKNIIVDVLRLEYPDYNFTKKKKKECVSLYS